MAVFDQRRELNQQMRQVPFQGDDNFALKMLGYNERGQNNAWGHVLNFVPGVNTGRHLAAQSIAGGDTKKVLKDTLDETIARDVAGIGLGINIAKTVATAGLGGMAGIGGAAAGSTAPKMANLFGGAGGGFSAGQKSKAMDLMTSGAGNGEMLAPEMQKIVRQQIAEGIQNPNQPGTPEYNAFERIKQKESGGFKNQMKNLGSSFIKSAGTGNIFESAGDYATMSIADYTAKRDAYKELSRGSMMGLPFNYL